MQSMLPSKKASGFTLVEIMVVAPIVLLVISGFITLIILLTGNVLVTNESNKLIYNTQDALDRIEQDVRLTSEFRNTSFTPDSPQGQNDSGTAFSAFATVSISAQNTYLILRSVATDKNPLDSSRAIIRNADAPYACSDSANIEKNSPFAVDYVYYYVFQYPYMTLWRRTVFDANATPCSTPWQTPSCSPTQMAQSTVPAACKTEDEKILSDIYYPISYPETYRKYRTEGVTSAVTDTSNGNNPYSDDGANAKSLDITITTMKGVAGRTPSFTGHLRTTRLNTPLN